ncbi:DinB family protein [Pontibacter diazotrophicus]|uniref:DinB family protein n=2 Tax=Pontibacter diazotrophicus TaxID=1400979 RepID=A0A3D8L5E6_9BACT|nr:DinB family protein [Pontibacter diazotrophicus]
MKFSKQALFIVIAFFIQHSIMAQSYFKKDYPGVWQRATDYTLEVAEAMPAENYNFKPLEESMSFQEQLTHVVQNISFLSGLITGESPDFFKGKKPEALTKAEVNIALGEAFRYVGRLVKEVD